MFDASAVRCWKVSPTIQVPGRYLVLGDGPSLTY